MNFHSDSQPWGIPVTPTDPLDVFKRNYPWAQPIEMPHTVYDPTTSGHPYGIYATQRPSCHAR